MVDFKKDSWFYALIAAIIGIIAIFLPMGIQGIPMGGQEFGWLGGYVSYRTDLDIWSGSLTPALFLLGVTIAASIALLIYSVNTWRGKEFKSTSLIYLLSGIGMVLFVILLWVFEFDPDVTPIAPVFILISGILALVGGVLEKQVKDNNSRAI